VSGLYADQTIPLSKGRYLEIFNNADGYGATRYLIGSRLAMGAESILVDADELAAFKAALGVGQAQMFLSAPVDLTETPSGVVLVPSLPGFFFVPATQDPLLVVNLLSGGTLTGGPTVRAGNVSTHDNYASGMLDVDTFIVGGGTARTTRPAVGSGGLVTLADLAVPIVIDVLEPATGTGGFAWTVRFGLSGSFVPAF
jgi:hypothetical protein